MVNAKFCDIHKEQATSLIRAKQKGISFYTIILQHFITEKGKDGKNVRWTYETKLDACAQDVQDRIIDFAKGLGVELEYDVYRLYKDDAGKYHRETRDSDQATGE